MEDPFKYQSTHGSELISALFNVISTFTTSIIDASASPPNPLVEKQGQKLLDSLQNFIKSVVEPMVAPTIIDTAEANKGTIQKHRKHEGSGENLGLPARPIRSNELPPTTMEQARMIVFNKMPIRLLHFDSTGSQPRMLERNQILTMVLSSASHKLSSMTTSDECLSAGEQLIGDFLVQQMSRYAILSHTWIREEPGDVVYEDWEARERNLRGNAKIVNFCEVAARNHGVTLGWMDTVCINKQSSSELDESIRSMYRWYKHAHVCVAYMSETLELENLHKDSWFTRGWTLQELLAPRNIEFYDVNWQRLVPAPHDSAEKVLAATPNKTPNVEVLRQHVRKQIEMATSITEEELGNFQWAYKSIDDVPFSRVMQLAAYRTVTRAEDQIYSIMGILHIEITIAYGEGPERALQRLMREALNLKQNVLDLFNCGSISASPVERVTIPQFLPSDIQRYVSRSAGNIANPDWKPCEPIIFTHIGVRMPLMLFPAMKADKSQEYIPRGELSGTVQLQSAEQTGQRDTYHLLDDRIYSHRNHAGLRGGYNDFPNIIVFGVMNFSIVNRKVLFYHNSLAVPLNCYIWRGVVEADKSFNVFPVPHPVILKLHYKKTRVREFVTVSKDDVGKHGMQFATVYLR